jgi:uncharacterized protein (TIGR03086 family)
VNAASACHLRACKGFSRIVAEADGRWERPSPCPGWDARSVVEHVIGFHDALLLRPLSAKPERSKGDPVARWTVTLSAITSLLQVRGEDPTVDEESNGIDLERLLPILTTEVLVHTWDLARAVGVDAFLDAELCDASYRAALRNERFLRESGMYDLSVPFPENAPAEAKLVAVLGRDPFWTAP